MWNQLAEIARILSLIGMLSLFAALLAARIKHVRIAGNKTLRKAATACCIAVIIGCLVSSWAALMADYTANAQAVTQTISEELKTGEPARELSIEDTISIPLFAIFIYSAYIILSNTKNNTKLSRLSALVILTISIQRRVTGNRNKRHIFKGGAYGHTGSIKGLHRKEFCYGKHSRGRHCTG